MSRQQLIARGRQVRSGLGIAPVGTRQAMPGFNDLIDEVAFASLDLRLARKLLAETDARGVVSKTHQQLALDLGSVREVISRYLSEWERMGWVRSSRGSIEVLNQAALASYGAGDEEEERTPLRSALPS